MIAIMFGPGSASIPSRMIPAMKNIEASVSGRTNRRTARGAKGVSGFLFFMYYLFNFCEILVGNICQSFNNFCVKLDARLLTQILNRILRRRLVAIAATTGERIEHICDSKNSCLYWNILFLQPHWVTTSVPSFVMITYNRQCFLQEWNSLHDTCTNIRMDSHYLPFLLGQFTWLVQDGIANTYLADIVK